LDVRGDTIIEFISLREIVRIAIRQSRWLLAAFLVPIVVSVGLIFYISPAYRAHAGLLVKSGREYSPWNGGENSQSVPNLTQQEEVNSEIEIITARATIEATIDRVGLSRLYPDLKPEPVSRSIAADRFMKSLTVDPVKLSSVINLTFDNQDRKVAVDALDTLVSVYEERHLQIYGNNRSKVYLQDMEQDRQELEALEHHREKLKLQSGIYDISRQRGALINQKAEAENGRREALARRETLQTMITFLNGTKQHVPGSQTTTETNPREEAVYAHNAIVDLKRTESDLTLYAGPSVSAASSESN
jgi:uncharacterized protein involved in exopolysaccharide biosynthesis